MKDCFIHVAETDDIFCGKSRPGKTAYKNFFLNLCKTMHSRNYMDVLCILQFQNLHFFFFVCLFVCLFVCASDK